MYIRVLNQNYGDFTPKMDGENNGKPYEQMDDLGVPLFLETPVHSCLYLWTDGQSSPARWVLGTLSTCFAETDLGFLIWCLSNGFAMVPICFDSGINLILFVFLGVPRIWVRKQNMKRTGFLIR